MMKALMLCEYRRLEVVDVPAPTPAPDEVLIRVKACGICGSDVHGYDGSSGRRIPPIVMGHEAAGTVAAIGSEVSGIREGDRVVSKRRNRRQSYPSPPIGSCRKLGSRSVQRQGP